MMRVQKLRRVHNPPGTMYFKSATAASQYRTDIERAIRHRYPTVRYLHVDCDIHRKPEDGRYFIYDGNLVLTAGDTLTRRDQ